MEFISECRSAESLYIYGAGAVADMFYIYLKQIGLKEKVNGFVVTKLGGNVSEKFGLEVMELAGRLEELRKALDRWQAETIQRGALNNSLCDKQEPVGSEIHLPRT